MTEHQYDMILKALIVLLQTQEMTDMGMNYRPTNALKMAEALEVERRESAFRAEGGNL